MNIYSNQSRQTCKQNNSFLQEINFLIGLYLPPELIAILNE